MGFMNQRTQLGGSRRVVKGDWELLPRWAIPWSCLITRGGIGTIWDKTNHFMVISWQNEINNMRGFLENGLDPTSHPRTTLVIGKPMVKSGSFLNVQKTWKSPPIQGLSTGKMNDNYGWKQLKGERDQSEDADKACMHCQAIIHCLRGMGQNRSTRKKRMVYHR